MLADSYYICNSFLSRSVQTSSNFLVDEGKKLPQCLLSPQTWNEISLYCWINVWKNDANIYLKPLSHLSLLILKQGPMCRYRHTRKAKRLQKKWNSSKNMSTFCGIFFFNLFFFFFFHMIAKLYFKKHWINDGSVLGIGEAWERKMELSVEAHTCRQCADWLLARPRAVSWQSTGPDVTVVVPALEKVLLQEMDAEKGGKKTGAEQNCSEFSWECSQTSLIICLKKKRVYGTQVLS